MNTEPAGLCPSASVYWVTLAGVTLLRIFFFGAPSDKGFPTLVPPNLAGIGLPTDFLRYPWSYSITAEKSDDTTRGHPSSHAQHQPPIPY
jgi:hypothetical protein